MNNIKKLWKVWVYLKEEKNESVFKKMKYTFSQVPPIVKYMIINMSLLWFGRGIGVNMYYSIYLQWIFDNIIIISILWSLLALIKLITSIPTWILDKKLNSKTILLAWKRLFIVAWILYFIAWFYSIPWLVILAIITQGIATPMVFNTNQFLIRKLMPIKLSSETFGIFFSTYQFGYLISALLTAGLMYFKLPIPYFFLIASLFTIITLFSNTKSRKKIDKHGLFYEIKKDVLNLSLYKEIIHNIRSNKKWLNTMLTIQWLHWLLYYLGFMFIPILAIAKDLSLVQIAILFAIMRIPHTLTFYLESLFKKEQEFMITIISYIWIWFLLMLITFSSSFMWMLAISFLMSVLIATTRPMISGMITRLIKAKEYAEITWIQDFITRLWEIVWYMIFGIIAQYIWLNTWFIVIAIITILYSIYALKNKKNIKLYNKK